MKDTENLDLNKLNISEIKKLLNGYSLDKLKMIKPLLLSDSRKGVNNLIDSINKKEALEKAKTDRKKRLLQEENKIWAKGFSRIAGIDEVGRGPLAGPVVAACVVLPKGLYIDKVDDSKKLTALKREELYIKIIEESIAIGIGQVDSNEIDNINIYNASLKAMHLAYEKCSEHIDFLLIDAMEANFGTPYKSLIKGDENSHTIAAASIVAKVYRDALMRDLHEIYPLYGFKDNKGYGTKKHIEAIKKHGLCPIHRLSFTKKIIN